MDLSEVIITGLLDVVIHTMFLFCLEVAIE